ncbi:MAG: hypothetical protein IPH59_00220 [bacterium]|nr:hypothetical protein [bacterium]
MMKMNFARKTLIASALAMALFSIGYSATPVEPKGYLDYLDSYYQSGNPADLEQARNAIKIELDASDALRFQGYYYNAEIHFLMTVEDLKKDMHNVELQEKLRALMLQLYNRYLDAYYKFEPAQLKTSSVPGNTAFLVKDVLMAAIYCPNANSFAPLVKNVLRRATRDSLYDVQSSYVASVNEMLQEEYPNLFGVANFAKAVWVNDQFISMKQEGVVKDSLRRMVNYFASIAGDTLRSSYGLSISYFLLAETFANHENDMAWSYFRKCLEQLNVGPFPTQGFYARNYNREIYIATCVTFLPTYAEHLYKAGRYPEILSSAKQLIALGVLDRGQMESVSREAVFWGEKSVRALQDEARYSSADELFQQLKSFYEMLDTKTQLGNSE